MWNIEIRWRGEKVGTEAWIEAENLKHIFIYVSCVQSLNCCYTHTLITYQCHHFLLYFMLKQQWVLDSKTYSEWDNLQRFRVMHRFAPPIRYRKFMPIWAYILFAILAGIQTLDHPLRMTTTHALDCSAMITA